MNNKSKTPWQKITLRQTQGLRKQNHLLLMVLCCLIPIVLIIGFFYLFKGSSNWLWLIILLCPLLHVWMMKGAHKHNGHDKHEMDNKDRI